MSGVDSERKVNANELYEEEEETMIGMGSYKGKVRIVRGDPSDEMMLLWGLQQPTFSKPNAFVSQSSVNLSLDACGRCLSISQSPSSLAFEYLARKGLNWKDGLQMLVLQQGAPGVTGSVMWDSGVVLGKFLENAVESGLLLLQGKKVVELGAGCGLVGCIAALLGSQVILTDMPDRLRLLKKNVEDNLYGDVRGSAAVNELTWGDRPDPELVQPLPDFVMGSDVIYSEEAVKDLIDTLMDLSGIETTIILAGELRNDAILEYFMEAAMEEFIIGRVDEADWHPDYHSPRVAMYVLVRKLIPK